LVTWIEDDPYGFCFHLDREVIKVLDKKGLDAFGRCARPKYDSSVKREAGGKDGFSGYGRHRWIGVLKAVLAAQNSIDAYVELCRERGLGAKECQAITDMYRNRRRLDDALAWVKRGLEIARSDATSSFAEYDLAEMERALLSKLGRRQEALDSAWAEFRRHPSSISYSCLMRYVPRVEKKEFDRLAARLRRASDGELESLSHRKSDPAAKKVERSYPGLAARLYRASAMRTVNVGKSKYYNAALGNLEHAKKCYLGAGLDEEWNALVTEVRAPSSEEGVHRRF
jgi:tetratricopeptide (TPR) repeat protein